MLLVNEALIRLISRNSAIEPRLIITFNEIFPIYEINNINRIAAFLAQAAYETEGFKWFVEQGNPSYFKKYDPGTKIGKILGNIIPGDGYRFRGRGIFQLTGRNNYQNFGTECGIDLLKNPDLAADVEVACKLAGMFWRDKNLNPLADVENITAITRKINGGLNGLANRQAYYTAIKNHVALSMN